MIGERLWNARQRLLMRPCAGHCRRGESPHTHHLTWFGSFYWRAGLWRVM